MKAVATADPKSPVTPGEDLEPTPDSLVEDVVVADLEAVVTVQEVIVPGAVGNVKFQREGDDVVLTVGGKKRTLDDVDDSSFEPAEAVKTEQAIA